MKKLILCFLFLAQSFFVFSQQNMGVTGKIVDAKNQKPLQNVVVSITNIYLTQVTNTEGNFTFTGVAKGSYLLQIKSDGYKEQLLSIEIATGQMLDMGVLILEEDQTIEQQLSLITITENDLGDDNSGSESTSGLLQASRDAFQQTAAFNWGQARFRIRGLDNEYGSTMINGITMNKIYDGRPQYSNWGGLNDATRNQEFTMGSAPSDYIFGGILGTQEINTRASIYRPGSRVSFSGTNTNYSWRMMGTHASGMNKDGWAFVVSAGRRWSQEAYFEGTNYSANSFFASVEKRINDKHSLNLTSILAQNSRGKNSPNTDEVTKLGGVKYNSYWGYQNGRKRNSRYKNVEEPILLLSHYWKFNDKTNLNTTVSYQTGAIGNSRIDYQGVDNPDPAYYKSLPSYYTSKYDDNNIYIGNNAENLAGAASAKFLSNRQLDWQDLYDTNTSTSDRRSYYVLYEDRTDDRLISGNSVLSSKLSDNIVFNGGVAFRKLKSQNFQKLLDLLGGNYFKDIDNFGTNFNQQQSDLNNLERKVVIGDRYGYNYNVLATTLDAFTQFKFTYKKVDFYLTQSYVKSQYQREGIYRNGYYSTNSLGKSKQVSFDNFGFKGGLTYKLTGKHLLNFNGVYETKAPSLKNTFPNARVNNTIVVDLKSEIISSLDASYIIRAPKLKLRLTAYYSKIQNSTESSFFFADGVSLEDGDPTTDSATSAFLAETITGLDKKNIGGEFGIEYQLTSTIKAIASVAYGEFTYDSNPNVYYNIDSQASTTNQNPISNFGEVKLKGYKQPGTPQQAASFGLEYRDPKFWWIGVNANYLANNYIDIAPITRTANFLVDPLYGSGVPFPEATNIRTRELLSQEKFEDFTLFNLTGGKSWRISGKTIGFFASVNNVFNVIYKTGGYEQARDANFRQLNQDVTSGTPSFGPKYFYGNGRTYFVNLYINL
jgi:CarboxypepD_reg-like domain/TonB dependent receptor